MSKENSYFRKKTIIMNEVELRKYCLDKAIEIFSWRKDFFISKGSTPIEYAEALYKYITTGEKQEFNLPGTRIPKTPTPKPIQ
jgi:hypothetical protein